MSRKWKPPKDHLTPKHLERNISEELKALEAHILNLERVIIGLKSWVKRMQDHNHEPH